MKKNTQVHSYLDVMACLPCLSSEVKNTQNLMQRTYHSKNSDKKIAPLALLLCFSSCLFPFGYVCLFVCFI